MRGIVFQRDGTELWMVDEEGKERERETEGRNKTKGERVEIKEERVRRKEGTRDS